METIREYFYSFLQVLYELVGTWATRIIVLIYGDDIHALYGVPWPK